MNEVHDEVGKFTLEKETHVACVHAEVKLDHATPTNAGALLPWSTWEGSRYVIPTWATRWTVDACATSCCCSCGLGDSGEESTLPHCVMGERVPREQCPRSLCAGGPHGKRILAQGSSIAASSQGLFPRLLPRGFFPRFHLLVFPDHHEPSARSTREDTRGEGTPGGGRRRKRSQGPGQSKSPGGPYGRGNLLLALPRISLDDEEQHPGAHARTRDADKPLHGLLFD